MLIYLSIIPVLIACYGIYKYLAFQKSQICTTKSTMKKFIRFWMKSLRPRTQWEHFVNGQGTFTISDHSNGETTVYGGGISGTW
ncbi:MAG: hypothetical protein AAFO69_04600 [Bacteroidota bacterium]